MAERQAAERHLDTPADWPAGGRLVVLVHLAEIRHYEHLEAIVLRTGKVAHRARFPFRDTAIDRDGGRFTASTVIDLDKPPTAADPVALEVVGIGLNGAPFRFTVAPSP
jgi:hypothetical protein